MTAEAPEHADTLPAQRRARALPLWIAVALLLVTIAVALGPAATGTFSYWDDEDTISLNPDLNPPTWASLAERWSRPHLHIYVPLVHSVWHVLALVAPKPAAGEIGNVIALPFKLTNLAAHAVASVLVLLVLRRLVGPRWPALFGAIAFAVHPVQVESVAWASGLKDVMFGMFSAACILAYVGTDADRVRPRGRNLVIALAMLVLAGLSKPTAMVVPAMLLMIDLLCLRRPLAPSIARLLPFGVIGAFFAVIAWLVQPSAGHNSLAPPMWRPLIAIDTLVFYVQKIIVPTHLAYDYGRNARFVVELIRENPLRIGVGAIVILAVAGAALRFRKRMPTAVAGLLLFAIPLVPVLGFNHFDFSHYSIVADHYLYLPMIGVAMMVAAVLDQARRHERLAGVGAIAVACVWIVLTFRQARTWHDPASVTEQTLRVNPRSYASWSNLALSELRAKKLEPAEAHARKALELSPEDPQSAFVLANVLQDKGDETGAIEWVRVALKTSPYSAPFHHSLAVLLGKRGAFEESLSELEKTLVVDPKYPGAAQQAEQVRKLLQQRSRPSTRATMLPATRPAATSARAKLSLLNRPFAVDGGDTEASGHRRAIDFSGDIDDDIRRRALSIDN